MAQNFRDFYTTYEIVRIFFPLKGFAGASSMSFFLNNLNAVGENIWSCAVPAWDLFPTLLCFCLVLISRQN